MASPVQSIIEEQQRRGIRASAVPVVALNSRPGGKALAAGLPGMAHVILARKGSGVIEEVREAIDSSEEALRRVIVHMTRPSRRGRKPLTPEALARLTVKQPVFAELRSGGERLHSGLFVPTEARAIPLAYPYNGGPLPSSGLELVEYVADGAEAEGLEALALKSDPVLTKAEAAALKLVPKDQAGRNVGPVAKWCDSTWVYVGTLTLAAAGAGLTYAVATTIVVLAATPRVPVAEKHLSDEVIQQIGPGASARRMLELRRKALIKAAEEAAGDAGQTRT
jgi:hypothetical protein